MKEEMPHDLIEMVKGNAAVINEIYDSVMAIRKASSFIVSLLGSALGDMNIRLENQKCKNEPDKQD